MPIHFAVGRNVATALVSGATFALMALVPASVHADAITNNFGLASPATTITFSELAFANDTPITNEFAPYGVTFSPVSYYDPQPGFFPTPSIGNFDFTNTINPVSLFFNGPINAAAFEYITNNGTSTFTARLGGVDVESFSATTDVSLGAFYGFQNITFDEISISAGGFNNASLLDNLQLGSVAAVPEPGVVAFGVFAGGSVLGLIARRRRA